MADTEPPVPRKRGRPPKNKEGGPTAKPVTLGPDGLPRKRGRPRKNPVVTAIPEESTDAAPATVASSEPKKRGRPRKDPVEGSAQLAPAPSTEPRKRGRPRKIPVQESTKEVDNSTAESPKKRGRPPKKPADEMPAQINGTAPDAPKKRGRPRKVPVQESSKETDSMAVPKKGRGRPPKRPVDETPAQSTGVTTDAPKRRGRPRKSEANETTKADEDANTAPKRGRGRPRKSEAITTTTSSTKNTNKTNVKNTKQSATGLRMEDIVGTYTVECEAAEDYQEDKDEHEAMELCIVKGPGGYMAEFDLGPLEGMMLLAPDKASLDAFVESKSERSRKDAFSETDDESEDDKQPPKKKSKSSAFSPSLKTRRVLFKWRAKETGEGQIYSNLYPGDNEGYLEFTDNKAQKFVGFAGFPYMGQNCKFTGTRLGEASELSKRWSDFSPRAADEANERRWK